tara:strand:- start:464 stop:1186 length:723 start_codon:yes stop_codon:yes gene_type:complete
MNVYWSCRDKLLNNELSFIPPSKLSKELSFYYSQNPKSELNYYLRCPAFKEKYKNTFVIKAFKDYYLEYIPQKDKSFKITSSDKSEEEFYNSFMLRDPLIKLGTLQWLNYYYSDTSLEMETFPAYHFNTEFNQKTNFLDGQFNINKWFRPIDLTFSLRPQYNSLSIKRGDPLFYIRFKTKNKVKLTHFKYSQKLHEFSTQLVDYKEFNPQQPFKKLYDLFLGRRYNVRILKEIKNNLTGY